MMWLFLILWIITSIILWGAFLRIGEVQSREKSKSHAMCIAAVFAATGQATAARALRDAADRFESTDEIPNLTRIRREQYKPDGPSVPALWLRAEADRVDPSRLDDDNKVELLDGRWV